MSDKLYFDTSEANNLDALSAESDPSIAKPYNVKENYMYKDAFTKSIQIGTMPINTSVQVKIDPQTDNSNNWFYVIPEGYHDGIGRVYAGELSEYTSGNALPEDVLNNKVFWVDGERRVGTLSPERYEQSGTATADDLLYDKTAWVNGEQITGTIPILPRRDQTLLAGESYTFPYGLSPGTTVISAASLEIQTPGTATAAGILKGLTAWVNGEEITGTVDVDEMIETALGDTNTTQDDVLYGKTFYSSVYGQTVEGRMPDHTGEATKELQPGEMYAIPKGYYDGNSYITTKSLETSTEGTATAEDIVDQKTAWVNGKQITGTMPVNNIIQIRISAGKDITIPAGYYPNGVIIFALYTDNILDLTGTEAYYLNEGLYPNGTGYVDDTTFIVTAESITVET